MKEKRSESRTQMGGCCVRLMTDIHKYVYRREGNRGRLEEAALLYYFSTYLTAGIFRELFWLTDDRPWEALQMLGANQTATPARPDE